MGLLRKPAPPLTVKENLEAMDGQAQNRHQT